MIRRSRISVRPNVKPAGRTLTAAPASGEGSEVTAGSSLPERTNPEDAQRSCSDLQDNTGHEQDESSEPQRRKHFGPLPNLENTTLASSSETPGSSEAKPDLLTPRARVSRQAQVLHSTVTGPTQEPHERRAEDTEEPLAQPEADTPCSQPPPTEAREKVPEPADSARLHPVRDGTKLQSASTILSSLSGPADVLRLAQARRLRDLLKMEMNKDKVGRKKSKMDIKQRKKLKDHTKMTMKELIYYLPSANPMRSFSEEEAGAATAVARTPERLLSDSHTPPSSLAPAAPDVQEEEAAEREEAVEQTQEEEPSLGPRVKVAEDGSLIIDEESLTIQVSRTNGPNLAEENDPIFERGSTTTYSSFRKGSYTKPWSSGETEMFFLAISMVGTDFSMIGQLFPHRARLEIKNKFKKEERRNSWRIDKAFKEKRRLDLKFFQTLMEQMLKEEKLKKGKKRQVKVRATVRRRAREIYTSTEEESDSDVIAGEKENKDVWNDGDGAATAQKKKIAYVKKRRKPRRNHTLEEAELPADRWTEREASGATSRAGTKSEAPRPSPDISRRPQQASPSEEPVSSEHDEELDLMAVREQIFNKPTRSGRIPKLSQHVMPSADDEEEDEEEEEEEEEVTAAPGPSGNHAVSRTGKSRLLTLLASVDEDEEEQEEEWEEFSSNPEDENQAFVPLSLRRQPAVNPELEETMEELDISVPGVLCSELSCDQSRPEPSDHQLDLLVDVIEYLDPDHMEGCQELNTEAAETLLTIGSSVIQTGTGVAVENNEDSSYFIPEDVAQEEVVTETVEEQGGGGSDEGACPSALLLESQPPPKRGRFSKPKPNVSRISRARPVAPPPGEARPPPSLSPRDTGNDVPQTPSVMIEGEDREERAAPLDDSAQEAAAEGGGAQESPFITPVAEGGEDLSTNLQVAADGGTAGSTHGEEEHLERSGRRARLQVKPKLPLRRKTAAEGDAAALPVKETTQKLSSSTSADMSAGAHGDSGTISRPGRRPKGFLSFISSNPTQAAPAAPRGPRTKPAVSAARPVRKREAVSVPQSSEQTASVSKFLFSDIFTEVEEVDVD